jgi:hypothetical protein
LVELHLQAGENAEPKQHVDVAPALAESMLVDLGKDLDDKALGGR